ncbi:MAG: hypothetical protein AUJ92_11300 [Armatimonadetes bacterium CG2_30_59_28]|nr:DUF4838 domain-containing protein [Armatimonadota bacterium]OIO93899.1 MAG: hypothetical protein AUJ92_11300 [Armatimonadetes bacterium CG2_30_59_28]PIU64823.1 MAG: hypothetical protein COS85_11160 [Armatimonadetes bacterium CG07_land_8_20_14_0_80_59_28]PIY44302.1 MAG: hypothetical protein COZ05_08595 [Armatimonadetes bacterium CG_4_10_14_3_um_filter_59_10]
MKTRHIFSPVLLLLVALLFLFPPSLCHAGEVKIEIMGIPASSSVLPPNPTVEETGAAAELADYLEKISGVRLERKEWVPSLRGQKGLILVGRAALLAGMVTEAELAQLDEDAYRIRVRDGNACVAGGSYKGTLYGVYAWLQQMGARFYADQCERIPSVKPLRIPEMDVMRKPSFEMRLIGSGRVYAGEHSLQTDVGDPKQVDPKADVEWCHTSAYLVPFYLYGKEHPEYFAMNEKGQREATLALGNPGFSAYTLHLCFSNPQVRKIATERLLAWIEKQKDRRFFSVLQADGYGWCQCEECKKLDTVPGKVTSDRLLDFVNELAGAVAKKYPDKIILTGAYTSFTGPPPHRLKPAPNVRVMYCPYPPETPCQGHGLRCEKNKAGWEWYKGWLKWCPNQLYIYDYPVWNLQLLEFTHEAIAEKLTMYAADGVRGIYFCGRPVFLRPLFDYVEGHRMWDPKADTAELTREFMEGYFGTAADPMLQFYQLLARAAAAPELHQGAGGDVRHLASVQLVREALGLFNEAEAAAADSALIRKRLGVEKSFVLYSDLVQRNPVRGEMPDGATVFQQRLVEYLTLAKDNSSPPFFNVQDADTIRGWFWRTARLRVKEKPWHTDPVVKQLLADPAAVLERDVAANRALEPLPGGRGWRIPLELFEGGRGPQEYKWDCPPRLAAWIYGTQTGESTLRAKFHLNSLSARQARLALEAQDDDKPGTTLIRIVLNGEELFRGPNGFVEKGWSDRVFPLPSGLLRAGANELMIQNLEESANVQAQWFMLAEARLEFGHTLFLAHFDKRLEPEVAANPEPITRGEVKIHPEGKWGGALDASYTGEWPWSLYYEALDHYQPRKGTVEMWVKPKWAPGEERYVPLINIHGPSTFHRSGFLFFRYTTHDHLSLVVYNEQGGPDKGPGVTAVGGRPLTWEPHTWHHVAMTWDAEIRVVQIFVDGVLNARLAGEKVLLGQEVTDRIYVGCMHASPSTAGALIDELRISDEVLWTGTQVGQPVFHVPQQPYH